MGRYAGGGRQVCESCKSIDVRILCRDARLAAGQWFSWQWTRGGEPSGQINIRSEGAGIVLSYRIRSHDADWAPVEQPIPVVWTSCHYGGRRPWFQCAVYSNGRYCGKRVAILYLGGKLFACRKCYDLTYASQQESPRDRGVSQAQKIRERLGGSVSLFDLFPQKPRGMHWRTYERLRERAERAEDTADALMMQYLSRRSGKIGR